ncbi:MAG TPA: glutamate-cysteine ligase family protein [Candidatus Bathyarchaeia archaeon]|nr:glutamate-cysteine ligase family protein [Candidatus Bathyarchaeia archaeon]
MPRIDRGKLTCPQLAAYFRAAFRPRSGWLVGIEVEKMGLDRATGRPLPYDGAGASVRFAVEAYREARGGAFVYEGDRPVGIDAPWGGISLEPGGQFEWSARPAKDLDALDADLKAHLDTLAAIGEAKGIRWLDVAVQPEAAVASMPWMPKARYGIMRDILGRQGALAHRMMTQTASIQCAFDFASDEDWTRKFRAAALLAPAAVALFANSSRVDGKESGYASYRQRIWRETDPDRCDLPAIVFDKAFSIDAWVEWVCDVPTLFLRRGNGLAPSGGAPFRALLDRCGCDAVTMEDWELHLSSIFTEVRSYTYVEVRSADLTPDNRILAVPALWTGLLYNDDALDRALALGAPFDDPGAWRRAMDAAAKDGLAARSDGVQLGDIAASAVSLAMDGLSNGAACAGTLAGVPALARLLQ